jgi:hypothetical protein
MFTILLSLLFQLAVPAQQTTTTNPADLCTIQGVVIKAGTGEPLHKAIVDATPVGTRNDKDNAQGGAAEADEMGRFELKGLAPGRYHLTAQRNGFVRQPYGQRTPDGPGAVLTLSAGQKVSNITFQMIPAAVITGHVYDEDGEPMVYAQVLAMHYGYMNGQRQLVPGGVGQTDDLGGYRIFGLSPGQYYVQVNNRNLRFDNAQVGKGYVPIYYPGVPDATHAAPITVRGGDEFSGVDVSLQPVRSVTVKGTVINGGCGDSPRGAMVFLHEQNPQGVMWQNSVRPASALGAFEIANVIPGSYYLYAQLFDEGKQCLGRQALEVSDADIDGVTLALTPGVEIKGHLRVEGQTDSTPGSFSVSLNAKGGYMPIGGRPNDAIKPDGSFLLKNIYDGDYEVFVTNLPDNNFMKSARLDGVDVLTAGVTIDSKQAPGSLEILISPNGANVDGVISKDQQPFQGATVTLIPDPPHRGERRLFKSTTTDQNGHFVFQGVPPGDFKVFAWEKIDPGAYTSSEFIQPYEKLGESVHVTEGSRNSVQVDLIPAKDLNP